MATKKVRRNPKTPTKSNPQNQDVTLCGKCNKPKWKEDSCCTCWRPTKFKEEYSDELLKYFDIDPYREVTETVTYKDGTTKDTVKLVPNTLPSIEKFAASIWVNGDTIVERANARYPENYHDKELRNQLKHPQFSATHQYLQPYQ